MAKREQHIPCSRCARTSQLISKRRANHQSPISLRAAGLVCKRRSSRAPRCVPQTFPEPPSAMSTYKRRELPPVPRRDAFTAALLLAAPSAAPILAAAASVLATLRKGSQAAEWSKSRAAGAKHWQALINGWVAHSEAAKADAGVRADYAESWGSAPEPAIVAQMKRRAHETAVRKAEASLSALRGCLSKMRVAFDELHALQAQLQSQHDALCNLSLTIGEEGADFASKLIAADAGAAAAPLPGAGVSVLALGEHDEPFTSALDAAVAPGSNLTIGAAVRALVAVVGVYARELHSKTALLQAIDVMIHRSEIDAPTASATAAAQTLLPPLDASASDSASAAPPLVTSVHALDLYLSSWLMEPELDVDLLSSTQHLWDTQLPATK